jgi:hypothetical protein
MRAFPVFLALAAAGCADFVAREEFEQFHKETTDFQLKASRNNDLQVVAVDEARKQLSALHTRTGEMELLLKALQASVAHLEEDVKLLKAQVQAAAASAPARNGTPAAPSETGHAQPAAAKLEDILLEIETTLTQLRSGKIGAEEAAALLKPHARHAAPRLFRELREAITKPDYARQLEAVLARFPAEDLRAPIREALGQFGVRESAARVAGTTRDPEVGKILEEHTGTNDEDFRLCLGEALVLCRKASGIPLLVESLRSPQAAARTIAIAALRRLNRGDDLGYRALLSPEQNAAAVQAWEEWARTYGKVIFD